MSALAASTLVPMARQRRRNNRRKTQMTKQEYRQQKLRQDLRRREREAGTSTMSWRSRPIVPQSQDVRVLDRSSGQVKKRKKKKPTNKRVVHRAPKKVKQRFAKGPDGSMGFKLRRS